MMPWSYANEQAERLVASLRPYSIQVEAAGSLRRRKEQIRDLDVVACPDPLHAVQFATAAAKWAANPGKALGKKTPIRAGGMLGELYLVEPESWASIMLIRTGSATFSRAIVTIGPKRGVRFRDGLLWEEKGGAPIFCATEHDLFSRLELPWIEPWERSDLRRLMRVVTPRERRNLAGLESTMAEEAAAARARAAEKAAAVPSAVQGSLF